MGTIEECYVSFEAAPQKQQLCSHLPSILETIRERAGHSRVSEVEILSDVLLWTSNSRIALTYLLRLAYNGSVWILNRV